MLKLVNLHPTTDQQQQQPLQQQERPVSQL
jgi:hypothetical protein